MQPKRSVTIDETRAVASVANTMEHGPCVAISKGASFHDHSSVLDRVSHHPQRILSACTIVLHATISKATNGTSPTSMVTSCCKCGKHNGARPLRSPFQPRERPMMIHSAIYVQPQCNVCYRHSSKYVHTDRWRLLYGTSSHLRCDTRR